MLLPAGADIKALDGRVFKNTNPQAVVDKFRTEGLDIPIDINHAEEKKAPKGEPAPAVGWIKDMEVREGAIWARVEWTDTGAKMVASKDYRYLSPSFWNDKKSGVVTDISSAALVNKPALVMPSLAHSQLDSEINERTSTMDPKLLALLGLAADATPEQIFAAVQAMKDGAAKSSKELDAARGEVAATRSQQPSLEKFVPRADFEKVVARAETAERLVADEKASQFKKEADAEIDAALKAGKIAPISKDFYVATCATEAGLKLFRDFVKAAPVVAPDSGLDGKPTPIPAGGVSPTDEQLSSLRAGGCAISAEDLKKQLTEMAAERPAA